MMQNNYFKKLKQKFEYQVEILPFKISYAYYDYGIFIKIDSSHRKSFDIDNNIPVPEMIQIILDWLSNFYPMFIHQEVRYRELSSDEILKFIKNNPNISEEKLIEYKKKYYNKIQYKIEKVFTHDKTFILSENGKKYLYKYPSYDIIDFKDFIKESKKSKKLYEYIFSKCWMIKIYEKSFCINIRYTGKQMENFFKLNVKKLKNEKIEYDKKLNCWKWSRYNIYFCNDELKNKCLDIIK